VSRLRPPDAALAGVLLLGACTGVPGSSAPQTIEQVTVEAQPDNQPSRPAPGTAPREIVHGFLGAQGDESGKHTYARAFLTTDFRARWTDATATVIANNPSVGIYNSRTHKVLVVAKKLGSLDAHGVYTPNTEGDGTGSDVHFEFTLTQAHGQYRIDQLRGAAGLILSEDQFASGYKQRPLYFYDNAEQYLVPDPRYSDIVDRGLVSEWLLTQLVAGPQDDLGPAVTSDTLPAQTDPSRITVKLGLPTLVEIPGSSQLDSNGRNRLAAQLSETLADPLGGNKITVTDGGRPVPIPAVQSTEFGPDDFASELAGATVSTPEAYYLQSGRLLAEDGAPVGGPLGHSYLLQSVALSRSATGGSLLAAGVLAGGSAQQLWAGNAGTGLKPTPVRGALTRPSFAHGRREVWIGAGARLYRVALDAAGNPTGRPDAVSVAGLAAGTTITSVRVSPDGVQVALVLAGPAGPGQLWIGSIIRGTGQLQIGGLHAISPKQAVVKDVAWFTSLRLFAIGRLADSTDSSTFDTGVDGTHWSQGQVAGLPRPPDQVTVTSGASAWVSAGGFVWVQSGGQWSSPTGGQTPGTSPVYVE
jgi:hypothetical protein